jgi:iron-sulfur cluster repair protein YtfE (RIC family)
MSQPPASPSLVAQQVEQEHDALRDLLGAILKQLSHGPGAARMVVDDLSELCELLDRHFHTEEDAGFFAEIIDKDARFTGEASRLCEEHATMLRDAKSLADRLSVAGDAAAIWPDLKRDFHELSKHLMRHEGDENRLLQQAYVEDIGSKD